LIDDIRHYFPEYSTYVAECPEKVDKLTRKEAGYIAETLVLAALQAGRNVILHCQLRDVNWYRSYITNFLRPQFTSLKVAILRIEADHEIVQERTTRARQIIANRNDNRSHSVLTDTENVYDSDEEVEASLRRIPQAVSVLEPIVDFCCVIHNKEKDEPKLVNENNESGWDTFQRLFDQTTTANAVSDDSSSGSDVARESDRKRPRVMTISRCLRLGERRSTFSSSLSTEENHRSNDNKFYGQFAHIREKMDYTYHSNYTRDRQFFQDAIISEFMKSAVITDKNGEVCTTPTEPWLVFTAGAMGAGKSYTMNKLVKEGRFPLLAFVQVDPDAIRMYIPEYHIYVAENPEMAGKLTQKEAGYIAEMLTMAGLQSGKNVLVDGSLRNYDWYSEYFSSLRSTYSNLRISIIHVTAPAEAVFKRAEVRDFPIL
jgi:predicted kinase